MSLKVLWVATAVRRSDQDGRRERQIEERMSWLPHGMPLYSICTRDYETDWNSNSGLGFEFGLGESLKKVFHFLIGN
jgi:hypothetical protein